MTDNEAGGHLSSVGIFNNRIFVPLKLALAVLCLTVLASCLGLLVSDVEPQVKALKSGQYRLDQSHASLIFKVSHMGLSTYVGRFNSFDASLDFNADSVTDTRLHAQVDMRSLDINNPELADDLQGASWFNSQKFPQASFSTLEVRPLTDNEFEFVGELDWRGIQKPVVLLVTIHGGAMNRLTGKYTIGFSANGVISRSDFGMDAYIPLVGDRVQLEVYAEFQRTAAVSP